MSAMRGILGIDPGSVSGAWGFIVNTGQPLVGDLPVLGDGVFPKYFYDFVVELQPKIAIVERVNAMPGQGISSTWKFAKSYGIILAALQIAEVRTELVSPTVWKKHFNLPGKDKEKSRELVARLFPTVQGISRVKDHGRCEALLIAEWWRQTNDRTA